MHQPVQWQPWRAEAFARAAREDKPILLDVGATWCHWCHVMDRESYEDPSLADFINEHFVAIKVDRDERPDIDARCQAAVSAISGRGGWPLTVFLTPLGQPFFGGTYFPNEERYGQPGFQRVLATMAASFHGSRADVEETAASVLDAVEQSEMFSGEAKDLSTPETAEELLGSLIQAILKQFDPAHGGFGSQPKFLHTSALRLLLDSGGQQAIDAALYTLTRMSRGGISDQLDGGFHRYSIEERWIVPHFEKMSYDNAELLRCYVRAYQRSRDADFAATASGIIRWMRHTLSDAEHGGFFASQSGDRMLEYAGKYFTWSYREAAEVLDPQELRLAETYFDLGRVGDMKHDPERNVLFRSTTLEAAAQQAGLDVASASALLASTETKLRAARARRPAPAVDTAMYTAWNSLCISAFVEAGAVLQDDSAVKFAQQSLDRLLAESLQDGEVFHAAGSAERTAGLLDDYALLASACLDVGETTGSAAYSGAAQRIADWMLARFYDEHGGGFFDTDQRVQGTGVLRARRKPIQDSPTAAGNSVAALLLLRLYRSTGQDVYRQKAQETLECFAPIAEHLALYAGMYGVALAELAGTLPSWEKAG